jgi:hypothetical protein
MIQGKTVPFTDADVARHASSAAFEQYNKARMSLIEQRMAREFEAELKERLNQEPERLMAMDEEQHKVRAAYRHSCEELLTLKCPRPNCKQAFIDFEGCFALRCAAAAARVTSAAGAAPTAAGTHVRTFGSG